MSKIIDFYQGKNVHPLNYTIEEMWTWEGRRLETIHDFIQWLFPLNVSSANSLSAPILTREEIAFFKSDNEIRGRVMKSFYMMLKYYGFTFNRERSAIERSEDFKSRSGWLYPMNHNYLRITRILSCLMLLDFEQQANMFFATLKDVFKTHAKYIGQTSYGYWCRAVGQEMK